MNIDFIKGMGKRDGEFVIILNIDEVFSAEEIALVTQAGGGADEEEETAE